MIYKNLFDPDLKRKHFAILADPENLDRKSLEDVARHAEKHGVDLIFIGGSLVSEPLDESIRAIKKHTGIPVVIFPGSLLQLSPHADGILLLSLISGRNPELLIGNHVLAAPILSKLSLEIISTGYILVGDADTTSVGYMSNSRPIPTGKTDLVVATAQAGEMLGLQTIYLESGSGARSPLSAETIAAVRKNISIPLIVGGGIRSLEDARIAYTAGADMVVVGNAMEKNPGLTEDICEMKKLMK